MFKARFLIPILLLIAMALPVSLTAQENDYLEGLHLMRQNKYEEAYVIFERLLQRNPDNYPVFDQALTCLEQLKRYEEAIDMASRRLGRNYGDFVLATRLGELYHLNGQLEEAYAIWNNTLERNSGTLQAYRYLAEMMIARREFEKAIEVFSKARTTFNNTTLFFSEVTSAYMSLGNREKAVETLLNVLPEAPGNAPFVLRQLNGFDDREVSNIAILELEDRSRKTPRTAAHYSAYREVLVGILMEQRLFRRALAAARSYENDAPQGSWPVYTLAGRLRSQNQFELAEEAYRFYITQQGHPLQGRSMEDLAILFITWSRFLTLNNMDYDNQSNDLYLRANATLDDLMRSQPNYQRRIEVFSLKSEIALDFFKNADAAEGYLDQIQRLAVNNDHRHIAGYLEGRIHIFRGQHARARVSLTRVNRDARIGEMAEKTRYYLALNDFYAGDFEFSSIQMRALERLSTSYYANDALRLRLWMQEGIQKDEVSEEIRMFSNARFLVDAGRYEDAIEMIFPLVSSDHMRPLKGDAVLLVSEYIRGLNPELTYLMLESVLSNAFRGPLRERILWERARIAEGILNTAPDKINQELPTKLDPIINWALAPLRAASGANAGVAEIRSFLKLDPADVFTLYEDLLFEFPQGFYSDAARDRLRELQTKIPS